MNFTTVCTYIVHLRQVLGIGKSWGSTLLPARGKYLTCIRFAFVSMYVRISATLTFCARHTLHIRIPSNGQDPTHVQTPTYVRRRAPSMFCSCGGLGARLPVPRYILLRGGCWDQFYTCTRPPSGLTSQLVSVLGLEYCLQFPIRSMLESQLARKLKKASQRACMNIKIHMYTLNSI